MDWNRTKQFYAAFWSAFPDLSAKIEEMVAEGDKVAIPVINTGTHKGEFQVYRRPARMYLSVEGIF
jgi:predicted ester cyclase